MYKLDIAMVISRETVVHMYSTFLM